MAPTAEGDIRHTDPEAEQAITDFFRSAAERRGPWEAFHRLRAVAPLYYSNARGMWFASGYRENDAILRHPAAQLRLAERMDAIHPDWQQHPSIAKLLDYIAFVDGDAHRKARLPLNPAWTPRRIEGYRAAIRAEAQRLVADFVAAGGGSFPDALAYPLAEHTLNLVFNFDGAKLPNARELVNTMQLAFEIDVTPEALRAADQASLAFKQFWRDEYARIARECPDTDIFAALLRDPAYSIDEVAVLAEALFSGGFDSTALTMTTGLHILLDHPAEIARARADPGRLANLPDELLRMTATIPMTIRVAAEDMTIEGQPVRRGELMGVMLGAANRDPAVFDDPDRLDLGRANGRHLGLSQGVHACLGRHLARIEMHELFSALIGQTRHIERAGEALFRDRQSVRGIEQLNLRVR